MAYLVSARKYRPQVFEELVGQEHVAKTLQNAIKKGKIGHAYLFSGPRGIGKTSAARIFAKALNCENGPTPQPCNQCKFCREIIEGTSLDLVEIDGASNRRIDEIRKLRENVRFMPSSARYKVYIIDEVHMLTNEAFNALLKTLEEPPEHIIFVFATTEVHKVPQTIRSRCQQFVFKKIPINKIVPVLKKILKDFSVEADEKALFWIAKFAEGSMRDAESILDQMISYSDSTITEDDVFTVLGMPRFDAYQVLVRMIAEKNTEGVFELVNKLIMDGIEVHVILAGLIDYFRALYLLTFDERNETLVELPREEMEQIKALLKFFTRLDIQNILLILSRSYLEIRNMDIKRELFEIALLKCLNYSDVINPAQILKKLEELKEDVLKKSGVDVKRSPTLSNHSVSSVSGESAKKPVENLNPHRSSHQNSRNSMRDFSEKGELDANILDADIKENASGKDYFSKLVEHLETKRRALAEFLKRSKSHEMRENKIMVVYSPDEKYSYDHITEDKMKKILQSEVAELFGGKITIEFELEKSESEEDFTLSPSVEKVLEIFKGEIVSKNDGGGN